MICTHGVRLKDPMLLDDERPNLLETVFKYLTNNLQLICQVNHRTNSYDLRDDIIIPNVICDR